MVFQRANLRILKNKVQHAITGAFLSPDTKCYTISKLSGQPDSGNLGPTSHRVNLGCQLVAFATQVKISPPDFRYIYLLGSRPDFDFLVINPKVNTQICGRNDFCPEQINFRGFRSGFFEI